MNNTTNENRAGMGITAPFYTPHVENNDPNFKSLLQQATFEATDERTLCRFDLFCVRRPECGAFKNGKLEFTIRGDVYSKTPEKMMKYLLGIVKKYYAQYSLLMLRDNSKIDSGMDRIVLKMYMNRIERCKLPHYGHLLERFPLPEWLAVEVDEEIKMKQ